MKNKIKTITSISIVILTIVFTLIMSGCSKQSAIVGSWTADDTDSGFVTLTFKANGYFECEKYGVRLPGIKQSYLGEDRETGEPITAAPEEETTKAPNLYHGTWELTDNDILIINYGSNTLQLYWSDFSDTSSSDLWNIDGGTLTFGKKTFHK